MNKLLRILTIVCVLLPTLAMSQALAQDEETPPILFEADFDSPGLPAGLSAYANAEAEIVGGVLQVETSADVGGGFYIDETFGDHAFEVDVYMVSGNEFNFYLRDQDESYFCAYGLEIRPNAGTARLGMWAGEDCSAGSDWYTLDAAQNIDFPMREWVTVRFDIVGPAITILIDGEEVLTWEDDTYESGSIWVSLIPDTEVHFDNLKIYDLAGGTSPVAAKETQDEPDPEGLPETLLHYDGDYEDAVAELQELGVIPGGQKVFDEDYAWFAGEGRYFTALARNAQISDVVMAGELTLELSGTPDSIEFCSLIYHVNTDSAGDATSFVEVGIVSLGDVGAIYVNDIHPDAGDESFAFEASALDLSEPHHVLFVDIDGTLAVYVDGALAIQDFTAVQRSGSFGIALTSEGLAARCEGRNIWAYEINNAASGTSSGTSSVDCTISGRDINLRGGPGTNYATERKLNGDAAADGQAMGADGFVWWRLEDDTWARSDVVSETGDCEGLPTVEAPPPPEGDDTDDGSGGSGSGTTVLSAARTALNRMYSIGGQIDVALGGTGAVDCGVINANYEGVIYAPTFNVAGQSDSVRGGYNQYRSAITTFQNGVSDLYNSCLSPTNTISQHAWSSARQAINDAASIMESAIRTLGG